MWSRCAEVTNMSRRRAAPPFFSERDRATILTVNRMTGPCGVDLPLLRV